MKTAPRYALLNKFFNLFLLVTFLSTQIAPAELIAAEVLTNPVPLTAQPEISLEKSKEQQPAPAPQKAPTSLESLTAAPLTAATPQRVIEVRPGQDIQTAINQAQEGDKILIYAGTYKRAAAANTQLNFSMKENVTVEGVPGADGNKPVVDGYHWYLSSGMTVRNLTILPTSMEPNSGSALTINSADNVTIENVKTTSISGYGNSVKIINSEISGNSNLHASKEIEIFGNDNQVINTKVTGHGTLVRLIGDRNLISGSVIRSLGNQWRQSCSYYVHGACQGLQPPAVNPDEPMMVIQGANNAVLGSTITGHGVSFGKSAGILFYGTTGNKITNTIIANTAVSLDARANVSVSYSLLQNQAALTNITAGAGLLTNVDPGFVNLAAGDFHLKSNSPAISAGDPASPLDEFGTPREIGAFSYDRAPVEILPAQAIQTFSNPNFYFVYEGSGASTRLVLYKKTGDQVTKQVLLANDPALNPVNKVDVSPDGQTVIYAKRTAVYKDNGNFKHWEESVTIQKVNDPSQKLILTATVQALNSSPRVIEELRFEGNILVIKSKKPTRRVNLTTLKLA